MLLRHHEDTRNLETRQQRAVHALRADQVTRQHETELQHQHDYSTRAHRDLRKRHAMQLRQQPKSLKVRIVIFTKITLTRWRGKNSTLKLCKFYKQIYINYMHTYFIKYIILFSKNHTIT